MEERELMYKISVVLDRLRVLQETSFLNMSPPELENRDILIRERMFELLHLKLNLLRYRYTRQEGETELFFIKRAFKSHKLSKNAYLFLRTMWKCWELRNREPLSVKSQNNIISLCMPALVYRDFSVNDGIL